MRLLGQPEFVAVVKHIGPTAAVVGKMTTASYQILNLKSVTGLGEQAFILNSRCESTKASYNELKV